MPRQRSGRGPPAGLAHPRLRNPSPAARASDAEGAEGSGGAVGLAVKFGIGGSHPLRVRLGGRALQAAELRGARAAAGRAGGRGEESTSLPQGTFPRNQQFDADRAVSHVG